MVPEFSVNRLRNAEFVQFHNNAITVVTDNNPEALQVTGLLNPLKTANAEAEALLNKLKASSLTEELLLLDERRDDAINGINLFLDAHVLHFDPTVKGYARTLKTNLDAHGTGIAKRNYQEETAILNKIVTDWTTKPELLAATSALGLTTWLAELDTANKAFDTKFLDRNKEQSNAPLNNLKEKRADVMAAYDKLIARLNSYYDINNGADPYGKTVRELNALVEKFKRLLASRNKNGGNASPTGGASK